MILFNNNITQGMIKKIMRERSSNICAEIYLQFATLRIKFKQMNKYYLKPSINIVIALFATIFTFQSCSDDDCEIELSGSTSEVTQISENHHSVYTDIIIDASTDDVWEVLTDFDNMPNWSTSFQGLSGNIEDGEQVIATFLLADSTGTLIAVDFPHTLSYNEGVQFSWSDPIPVFPGIRDNHHYMVEEISECQTRFVQTDEFQGTDPLINTEAIAHSSEADYNQFNTELKTEVEK